jgi:RNA polymerase sigma-70 factor (ECF subfamily)
VEVDFTRLVTENQSMVFSLAVRFLRDRALAEELAQDVFLRLYGELHKIETPEHATWWLRRAICHRCIDEARRRKLQPRISVDSVPEPGKEVRHSDFFLNERVRRVVDDLPDDARMVVLLRYQEDLDPADIAEILRVPLPTVKSRLHRALTALRERLQKQEVYR